MKEKRDPSSHRTPSQIKKMDRGYNARPEIVERRVKQNQARALMEKEGSVKKGDDKDVHHKKPVRHGGGNSRSNLSVTSRSRNRAWRND